MGNIKNQRVEDSKAFRKGDLVRLCVDKCFTIRNGGKRTFPLDHWSNDNSGLVDVFYTLSTAEREALTSKYTGLDSAGEPKIVPRERHATVKRGLVYTVVKSRARPVKTFRKTSGLCLILDTRLGRELYIKRDLLEKV